MKNAFRLIVIQVALLQSIQAHGQFGLEGLSTGRYQTKGVVTIQDSSHIEHTTLKNKTTDANATQPKKNKQLRNFASEVKNAEQVNEKNKTYESNSNLEVLIQNETQSLVEAGKSGILKARENKNSGERNILTLDLLPGVIVNNSKSNYSYRDYETNASSIKIGADVWTLANLALVGSVLVSMDADLGGVTSNKSSVPVKYEHFDIGMKYRKHYALTKDSNYLDFSLLYSVRNLSVPSSSNHRADLATSGLGLGVSAFFPVGTNYVFEVSSKLFPKLKHEESNSGVPIKSGDEVSASRLEFGLGSEWKLAEGNSVLMSVNYSLEKNLFSGAPVSQDPETGLKPENVSVENSMLGISLGYRWGR